MALVPGVSRSGATITAGLFLGYTREDAARFSFLLSVPAVVLSGLFELRKTRRRGLPSTGVHDRRHDRLVRGRLRRRSPGCCAGSASHSTMIFVVYRVALGVLVLSLVAAGTISAKP